MLENVLAPEFDVIMVLVLGTSVVAPLPVVPVQTVPEVTSVQIPDPMLMTLVVLLVNATLARFRL